MKIICDTNVWYLLKSEPQYVPDQKLYLTASNYVDWFASTWMDSKHPKHQRLLDSYKASQQHATDKLIIDPYDYAAIQLTDYTILPKTIESFNAAEKCLNEMIVGKYNTKQILNIRAACSASKSRFVKDIIKNNSTLYKNCSNKESTQEQKKYKLNKDCVYDFIKGWVMTFPGFQGKTLTEGHWNQLEIFISTYYRFINNKPNSPKPNSMIDLLNFLYLSNTEFMYWSEEKEFLELVRQSFGNEIPPFIYPEGKIVKQIFN